MKFPAPDTGHASFPASDVGPARFPGSDRATALFPPTPVPVVFIDTETVASIQSAGAVSGVPWHMLATIVEVSSMATVLASVAVATNTVVDTISTITQIFDVVTSDTVVEISSSANVKPSATVISETAVDIGSAAVIGNPIAVALMQTTVDIKSEAVSVPNTSFVGTTTADVASTSTAIPVGVINSSTSVDIDSGGAITFFSAASMTKSGDQNIDRYVWTPIGPWTAGSGTTIVGNALRVAGSGNATIEVGSEWSVTADTKDWQVLRNGVVVWTKGAASGSPFANTFALAVADGDLLTVEGYAAAGTTSRRTILGGTTTYLRVIPT